MNQNEKLWKAYRRWTEAQVECLRLQQALQVARSDQDQAQLNFARTIHAVCGDKVPVIIGGQLYSVKDGQLNSSQIANGALVVDDHLPGGGFRLSPPKEQDEKELPNEVPATP